jgi:hypothetical protein
VALVVIHHPFKLNNFFTFTFAVIRNVRQIQKFFCNALMTKTRHGRQGALPTENDSPVDSASPTSSIWGSQQRKLSKDKLEPVIIF